MRFAPIRISLVISLLLLFFTIDDKKNTRSFFNTCLVCLVLNLQLLLHDSNEIKT